MGWEADFRCRYSTKAYLPYSARVSLTSNVLAPLLSLASKLQPPSYRHRLECHRRPIPVGHRRPNVRFHETLSICSSSTEGVLGCDGVYAPGERNGLASRELSGRSTGLPPIVRCEFASPFGSLLNFRLIRVCNLHLSGVQGSEKHSHIYNRSALISHESEIAASWHVLFGSWRHVIVAIKLPQCRSCELHSTVRVVGVITICKGIVHSVMRMCG